MLWVFSRSDIISHNSGFKSVSFNKITNFNKK
jgi:hypothetical protein